MMSKGIEPVVGAPTTGRRLLVADFYDIQKALSTKFWPWPNNYSDDETPSISEVVFFLVNPPKKLCSCFFW